VVARAYNDWVYDYVRRTQSDLPVRILRSGPDLGGREIRRIAVGFPVVCGFAHRRPRPISEPPNYEPMWSAIEETGLVVGMPTFPAPHRFRNTHGTQYSPGEPHLAGVDSQVAGFQFEAVTDGNRRVVGIPRSHPNIR